MSEMSTKTVVLLVLLFCFLSGTSTASQTRVEYSTVTSAGGYILRLMQGSRKLWTARSADDLAVVVPRYRLVIYTSLDLETGNKGLCARTFSGRLRWISSMEAARYVDAIAGGDALILVELGPTFGVTGADVRTWPDIQLRRRILALNVRTGRTRWTSNQSVVGLPVWTNGVVFVSTKFDVSPRAVQGAEKPGGKLPVWLEARWLRNRKLYWRKQIAGMAPPLRSVTRNGRHRALFHFSDNINYKERMDSFLSYLKNLEISIPLKHSEVELASLTGSVYRGNSGWPTLRSDPKIK